MSTAAEWVQQPPSTCALPLFGARGDWLDYSFETTGYGSVERCGPVAHRVTIVRPGVGDVLTRHHRLVRSGRLSPPLHRRGPDATNVHVLDRAGLIRTCADEPGSWLAMAQDVAQRCSADDEVARLVGPALRQLLWSRRGHLGRDEVAIALAELREAADQLASERATYLAAVDRWMGAGVHDEIPAIRLEIRVLAEMQRQWGSPAVASGLAPEPGQR